MNYSGVFVLTVDTITKVIECKRNHKCLELHIEVQSSYMFYS